MGPSIVVLLWIVMAVVGIVIFVVATIAEKKRKEAVQKLAAAMGLEYRDALHEKDRQDFGDFSLANQGRSRRSSNVIVADSGELRMTIFDYRYTTGGNNSSTVRQTVVLVRSQSLQLPAFSLGPEHLYHRLGDFLGVQDIDFEDDLEFSNRFYLRGPDEEAVRALMNRDRRKSLMEFHAITIEGHSDHFIFFQSRKRWEAENIKGLMEQAFQIYRLLAEPS